MDRWTREILSRFEVRADEIADAIAAATVAEVPGYGPVNDSLLRAEIRTLSRRHLDAFLTLTRSGGAPDPQMVAAVRERAVRRAREMVPLHAMLHSYLIAQRVISTEIGRAAGPGARSQAAALALTAKTIDNNVVFTSAMAEAYVEEVQGNLADLDLARRGLIDALLSGEGDAWPVLARRAIGLGFDPDHEYVAILALVDVPSGHAPLTGSPRWAAQAIARCLGRPERSAFVVSRERDLVALLDTNEDPAPRLVLERAASMIAQTHNAVLRVGIGTPFSGLPGFSSSYQEAHRALRHTTARRPFVYGPNDILLFDELAAGGGDGALRLIPEATSRLLADPTMRVTIEAFVQADRNITTAATALALHPNTLRYRLKRIARKSGRDPHKLADLIELIAATRLISAPPPAP